VCATAAAVLPMLPPPVMMYRRTATAATDDDSMAASCQHRFLCTAFWNFFKQLINIQTSTDYKDVKQ